MTRRERTLWKVEYKARKNEITWPINLNLSPGCEVAEAFLQSEGRVERDGKEMEYVDIRIYTQRVKQLP